MFRLLASKLLTMLVDIWGGIKYAMLDMGLLSVFVYWYVYLIVHLK
jgi:hypothetical protein